MLERGLTPYASQRARSGSYACGCRVADALDAGGVQAGKRDGKAVPELLLELAHHALGGNHQNAPGLHDGLDPHGKGLTGHLVPAFKKAGVIQC